MKRYTKLILLIVVFCFVTNEVLAQANAGQDKTICSGSSVQIGTTGSGDNCYKWSPETGLDDPTSPTPIVSPATTTTYTLTCTKTDLSSKSMDEVTVTVETPMVELTIENNITECMEGRSVTFTAEASDAFEHDSPILFTFNYEHPDGTPWTSVDWSFDLIEDNTAIAGNVPEGNTNHYFDTPIFVEVENDDCMATSSIETLRIYELWIEYFRDHTSGKDWKVVVGNNISYSAIASSDCANWDWDMEDGFPDVWNPTGGNAKSGSGMVIPNSDLPNSNDKFGESYGTVNVSCLDGEGNMHQVFSDDILSLRAKVFYDATATTNPGGSDPNWFYYYKDNAGGGVYSYGCNAEGTSYSTPTLGESSVHICNEAYAGDSYITTEYLPGPPVQLSRTGWSGENKYYANFLGVLAHEREHAINQVQPTNPNDTDNDFLTTAYEISTTRTDPNNKYSAWPGGPAAFIDAEVYAGGPIEQVGIESANTSQDWAAPGTNWD